MFNICLRATGLVTGFADNLAFRVQQKDRWEAAYAVLLCQFLVLRLERLGLLLPVGEINLDRHQFTRSEFFKRRLAEYFPVQLNTPTAPVRTGKVDQQEFFVPALP